MNHSRSWHLHLVFRLVSVMFTCQVGVEFGKKQKQGMRISKGSVFRGSFAKVLGELLKMS